MGGCCVKTKDWNPDERGRSGAKHGVGYRGRLLPKSEMSGAETHHPRDRDPKTDRTKDPRSHSSTTEPSNLPTDPKENSHDDIPDPTTYSNSTILSSMKFPRTVKGKMVKRKAPKVWVFYKEATSTSTTTPINGVPSFFGQDPKTEKSKLVLPSDLYKSEERLAPVKQDSVKAEPTGLPKKAKVTAVENKAAAAREPRPDSGEDKAASVAAFVITARSEDNQSQDKSVAKLPKEFNANGREDLPRYGNLR